MASGYITALPELLLLTLICFLLVIDTFIPAQKKRLTAYMSGFSLLLVTLALISTYPEAESIVFAGTYVLDPLATTLKVIICLMTLLVYFYAEDYLSEHGWLSGEFFILGLFSVLGMMILASAASFLTIYLGLELMSLSLYAMIAMHRQYFDSAESAMKYFILGAIASGLLLYGISIVYGITGHINLDQVAVSPGKPDRSQQFIGIRIDFYTGRTFIQTRCCAFSYVGAGYLSGRAHCSYPVYQLGAKTGCFRHGV